MLTKKKLPQPRPLLVAVTGTIGSGKSTVLNLFSHYTPVISADKINKELISSNKTCKKKLKQAFGQSIFIDCEIDTNQLKKIIFDDSTAKQTLEAIMHPMIFEKIIDWVKKNIKKRYLVVEVPILIESGWQHSFDKIIVVQSNIKSQLKRVQLRDKNSKKEIKKIIACQTNQNLQSQHANIIVNNNSDISGLKNKIKLIHKELFKLSKPLNRTYIKP